MMHLAESIRAGYFQFSVRLILKSAILLLAFVGITAATAQFTLTATIDQSEWTPSKTLILDLEHGNYTVIPPSAEWPANIQRPETRSGNLTGDALREVRDLAASAFASGLAIPACEMAHGVGWPHYVGNTGPASVSLTKIGVNKSSGLRGCWSDNLVQLDELIMSLFNFRSP